MRILPLIVLLACLTGCLTAPPASPPPIIPCPTCGGPGVPLELVTRLPACQPYYAGLEHVHTPRIELWWWTCRRGHQWAVYVPRPCLGCR